MKFIEKVALTVYSILVLITSIILCLIIFGWLDINLIGEIIEKIVVGETSSKVLLGFSLIFILVSIKCIFFDSETKEKERENQGILLENDSGKLMISKETIENLVNSVAKEFENTQEVITKVELDRENNVRVYATLVVNSEAIIKDLSANLQNKVKEKIKLATDLEVKEVNITIKKVAPKQENTPNA